MDHVVTAELGEIVTTVIDEAARYSDDPREVTRMAARVITRILQRGRPRRTDHASRPTERPGVTESDLHEVA